MDIMYLSIKQLLDIWFVSTFWLLWIMLLWTFMCKFLCRYMFSLLLGTYLVVEKLDHMVTLHLISRGTARTFLKVVALFYIPTSCVWEFLFLHILINIGYYSHLSECDGEGNGNPLQYSCLENTVDRGVWWVTVHGVAENQTQRSTR